MDCGDVTIRKHYNAGVITIAAQPGHTPRLRSLLLQSSSHWALKGLHVTGRSPEPQGYPFAFNRRTENKLIQFCVARSTRKIGNGSTKFLEIAYNSTIVAGRTFCGFSIETAHDHTADNSLKRDVDCFIRTYVPSRTTKALSWRIRWTARSPSWG